MKLEGSCSCRRVRFTIETRAPYPYQRCYCSICRKTGGGGGSNINMLAIHETLEVEGAEHVKVFQAMVERKGQQVQSKHERHFCGECGSHLWAWHPNWPELNYPVAGAIDTPLPEPTEWTHIFVGDHSRASWVPLHGEGQQFDKYPEESLEDWHRTRGLWEEDEA